MSTTPALAFEAAKHQFALWRTTKTAINEPIPECLWALIPPLMPHYKSSTLSQQFKISTAQFKKKFALPCPDKKIHQPVPDFVEVPLATVFKPAPVSDVRQPTVTIESASGAKLIITDVSSELLARLIQQFMD